MSQKTIFKLNGLEALSKKIQQMPTSVLIPAARAAGKKGMDPVLKEAIARAARLDNPETPIRIADHIKQTTKSSKNNRSMIVKVGVEGGAQTRRDDKAKGRPTHYRFLEYGTARSRARPFLRPALENNLNEILNETALEFSAQLDKHF